MSIGFIIALTLAIYAIIVRPENYLFILVPGSVLSIFAILYLFILKYTNIKFVGNLSSVLNVLFMAFVIANIKPDIPVLYKYMGGFYTIIGIFSISVLFATPRVVILNALIVLATILRVFLYTLHNVPDMRPLAINAFVNYTAGFLVLSIFLYLTQNFTQRTIDRAQAETKKNQEQNKFLIGLLENIETSSQETLKTSELLTETSVKLSQSAAEEAATTEEISSSIEEILSSVKSNTEKSEYTNEITSHAAHEMEKNKELILDTLAAVNDISKKILEISEIADKTDILSINAAIEAARAGEYGQGFAVVAQEIRKLADKTQNLAKEINAISQRNIEMSQKASDQLEQVIPDIVKSADLIKNIALASREQDKSIETISNAILQLSNTANETAATSEELSASAEELLAQAKKLKGLASSFTSTD